MESTIPLSKRLYAETKALHEQVESLPFILALRDQKLSKQEYIQYLADLKLVYQALEEGLQANCQIPEIQSLYDHKINRAEMLNADLKSFQAEKIAPSSSAQSYVRHLQELSRRAPMLLLAHAYVRYMGDLSGGRMLKKFVEQLFPGEHVAFYNFDVLFGENASGSKFVEYKNWWKDQLDQMQFSSSEQLGLIQEAKKAFEYAGNMLSSYK